MKFYKYALKFLTSLYSLILFAFLAISYVLFEFVLKVHLDSKNFTWIYSSSMQTLAALIALLPISYGFYINNLDHEYNDDLDSYIIERLKSDVYYNMMTVIVYSLIVIIINLFSFFFDFHVNITFIIALLTIGGIGLISRYIYTLFDPKRVKDILREYDTSANADPNQKVISLDNFITKYLELQSSVKDFISNKNDNEMIDTIPLYDIVDNLSKDFPQIQQHYDTFKEIIFHRNNLIHNYTDTVVDYSKYQKMLDLKERFDKLNQAFINEHIFKSIMIIRKTIETTLHEYISDMQKEIYDVNTLPIQFKEDIVSLLHSYFVSDYYYTKSLDEAKDCDFEVVQNNYSEKKLVGIDIKSIQPRNLTAISTAYFKRLNQRFTYLFLINFNINDNQFTIMYQTKEGQYREFQVS